MEGFINIENGVLSKWAIDHLNTVYSQLPTGRYFYKIERKDKRSLPQNRFLHSIFPIIKKGLQDIGYREIKTADDAKWVCKSLFLSYEIDNGTGGKIKMVRRTRGLTKEQLSTFISEIQQWASEYLGIVIADPNEQTKLPI